MLISYNNLTQWPKAGLFASILFLAGWSASLRFSKLGTRFFVAALGILFATFCRPEYFCLWFLWLALAGWQLTKMGAGDERIQAAR